jgi:hypothetical protein
MANQINEIGKYLFVKGFFDTTNYYPPNLICLEEQCQREMSSMRVRTAAAVTMLLY